jgi:putative nucleotidyltransferase with HDIG domain
MEAIGPMVARLGPEAPEAGIRRVSKAVRKAARDADALGRSRPDLLCVILPGADLPATMRAAERFREAIAVESCRDFPLIVRLGVAERVVDDESPEAMIQRAELDLAAPSLSRDEPDNLNESEGADTLVSYHAVTSLVSALAYRDLATAEHSRRVADLCVTVARGLMSERACYLLEVGALLHDIGKLGVPDAVLRKPGPLNDDEWRVMGSHDRLGVEIIAAAFGSPELIAIVRYHHAWYGGNPRDPDLPSGSEIPLGARILSIADSYDAMVSDRVYRQGKSREYAFAELRRCGGRQFDPQLVERFIATLEARDSAPQAIMPPPTLSKRAAFKIGLQIEKLAEALDHRDVVTLGVMAARLRATADAIGIPSIASTATELTESLADPDNWFRTLELTCDLLELCRSTQSTYIETIQQLSVETSAPAFASPLDSLRALPGCPG